MRTLSFLLLLTALATTPRVVSAESIDAGRGRVELTVPASYSDQSAVPLIVLIHGFGGSGSGIDDYLKLSPLADQYGFILAKPDGTATDGDVFGMKNPKFWNATETCCAPGQEKVDDSAYLARLIDSIKGKYTIDGKRVFLVGHSNGGFMSHRMAREQPGMIAAIVSLAGTEGPGAPEATASPVHVLQIHGTGDAMISYNGGEIQGLGAYAGAVETVARWASRNGCEANAVELGTIDLDDAIGGAETKRARHAQGCHAGGSAELWTIATGSHMPTITSHFTPLLVEWLMGHPKP